MKTEIIKVDTAPIIRAEIDSMVATAKMYPRDLARIKREIEDLATGDPETAKSCFYAVPRAGKIIIGPSVRLAEIITYCWEHIRVESRVVGRTEKVVTCEAVAWDMQKNISSRKTVQRRITNSAGNIYSDDMIIVTSNAGCSIAERNAVFKVIPPAVLKTLLDKIKMKSLEGLGDLQTAVAKAIKFFEYEGIPKEAVLKKIGKDLQTDVTEDDLVILRAMISTVNSGEDSLKGLFFADIVAPKSPAAGTTDFSKKGKEKAKEKDAPKQAEKTEEGKTDDKPAK